MAYYGGYAKSQEEYRKKEYETELEKTKEVYLAQTGLPWTEAVEQEFAHLWRLKLIKAPRKLRDMPHKELFALFGFFLLSACIFLAGLIGSLRTVSNPPVVGTRAHAIALIAGGMLTYVHIYEFITRYRSLQTIARIGEDAWREQVAKCQEGNDIEPWNAESHY